MLAFRFFSSPPTVSRTSSDPQSYEQTLFVDQRRAPTNADVPEP